MGDYLGAARSLAHSMDGPALRRSLLAALAGIIVMSSLLLDLRILPADGALGQDFNDFYAAALAQSRGFNPYAGTVVARIETQEFGHASFSSTVASPPAFFVVFRPLLLLSPRQGYLVWIAISVAVWFAAIGTAGAVLNIDRRLLVWLLALSPPTVIALFLGQISLLLTGCYLWAIVCLLARRPAPAGVLLALTLVKPHVMIVPVALLCGLSWSMGGRRAAAYTAGAIVALCALAVPFSEPDALQQWVQALLFYGSHFDRWQPDISSLAGLYVPFVPRLVERILSATCIAGGLAGAAWILHHAARRRIAPGTPAWWHLLAIGIAAWLLVLPYIHPYDDMVLLVPLLVLLAGNCGRLLEGLPLLAVAGMLSVPELDLMGFRPNLTFSYTLLPVLATFCALLFLRVVPTPPHPRAPHR